jgi:ParB family chromosome partitioning protein
MAARQCGIKKAKETDSIEKLFLAFLRRPNEGTVGRLLVEITILLAASRRDSAQTLSNAAEAYKVDVEAIRQKVRQEFAAKQKAKQQKKPTNGCCRAAVKARPAAHGGGSIIRNETPGSL